MNRKLLGIGIFILLVAIVATVFYQYKNKPQSGLDDSNQPKEFSVTTTEPENGFSKLLPQDLYIERGSNLLQNYEAVTTEGGKQATVITTTKKSLTQTVSDYVKYFESKNWIEIKSLFSQSDSSVVAVMKYGNDRVRITAQQNSETSDKTVEVTLTTLEKQK